MITLRPINSRFKRLIHDHGSQWVVVCEPRAMVCFGHRMGVTAHPAGDAKKLSNFLVDEI